MTILVLGVAFTDIKGFPCGAYDPFGTNKGNVVVTHGGVARNAAEDLANLGAQVEFPCMLDDSPFSGDVSARLKRAGVSLAHAVRVKSGGIGIWLAVFDEKGDLAGSISQMPDTAPLECLLDEQGDALISACDVVCAEFDAGERMSECTLEIAERYRKDVFTVIGNMSVTGRRQDLMARTRCVIMNGIEAGKLFSCEIDAALPQDALTLVWAAGKSMGLRAIIVTLGAAGCVYADFGSGECGCLPAQSCKVVDTTGAGDAFFSAAIMSIARGQSLRRACENGSHIAARVISLTESACPRGSGDIFED